MTPNVEEELRRRIAELEEEVADLRAERKELRDIVCAKVTPAKETTEEEYMEMMRNHVPGAGIAFLRSLGIDPLKKKS
jgi:regulator of replication initiation timing